MKVKRKSVREINEPQIKSAIRSYYLSRGFTADRVRIACNTERTGGTLVATILFTNGGPNGLTLVELRESAINQIMKRGFK